MVKVGDFLAQNKIFQQRWTTATGTQGVLIVGDAHALISGQRIIFTAFAYVFQRIKFFVTRIRGFQAPWGGRLCTWRCWFSRWTMRAVLRCQ